MQIVLKCSILGVFGCFWVFLDDFDLFDVESALC